MSSEATESTRMIEWVAWFEENKKPVLFGLSVVVVLVGALAVYRWNRNQAETQASNAMFNLERPSVSGGDTPRPGAQAYLEVATTYRGTSAGAQALLLGADALFEEGKYGEARAQFESFLQNYSGHSLAGTAAFGVAASLDAQDKTNEALTSYQDVVLRYPNSPVFAQAKLAMARLYEARNEPAQALKLYDELARPTSPSAWASEAIQRREQLLAQHPDLARTNAPPAPSTLSSVAATNVEQLIPTNRPAAQADKP